MNKSELQMLLNTLNQITVCGKNNLDMLLGCILSVEKMLQAEDTEDRTVTDNG